MESFDVIVIGASVAGAPTAMLLARQGYKVLLIDKHTFPRDTNSTHFIWPRGVSYLNRWGLATEILANTPHFNQIELYIEGIRLAGGIPLNALKQRFKQLHGEDNGVTDLYCGPRRYYLDNYLLIAAKQAGVEVREEVTYKSPIIEADRVVGIVADHADNSVLKAKATLVIGADGRFSSFARHVGAAYTDYRELSTFAFYSYFSHIERDGLAIHKKGRFGTAIFPTQNQTHMVLVYGPRQLWDKFKTNPAQNFHDIFQFCAPELAHLISNANRTENFKACGKMQAFQRHSVGPGWALIGDAGSFKDQVTAMGITHAFRDAELITTYIHRGLSTETKLDDALIHYQQVRSQDYVDYYNLVCQTAEMNPYTKSALKYYYLIRNNQKMIDQLIAEFADTSPIKALLDVDITDDNTFPDYIKQFDPKQHPDFFL